MGGDTKKNRNPEMGVSHKDLVHLDNNQCGKGGSFTAKLWFLRAQGTQGGVYVKLAKGRKSMKNHIKKNLTFPEGGGCGAGGLWVSPWKKAGGVT